MRITQWGEYGVHFAIYLAKTVPGEPIGAQELATSQGIALHYTQQILHRLRDGGILESVRGPKGGYRLARSSTEITLLDILIAAEGETLEIICQKKPLSSERCGPRISCNLRPVWFGLRDTVNSYLSQFSLEQLATESVEPSGLPVQITRNSHGIELKN